ncbi:MAG: alpha/beta fold hydrolase [Propionibacteriaceae bacterium]|nr:alpha/beta fold hydrolase [Propionibacteriaceae bacterium]
MGTGFYGANIEELRNLATTFDQQANALAHAESNVLRGLAAAFWLGPIATEFKVTWTNMHSVNLDALEAMLHDLAKNLRLQAHQQEQASNDPGGGLGEGKGVHETPITRPIQPATTKKKGGGLWGWVKDKATGAWDDIKGGAQKVYDTEVDGWHWTYDKISSNRFTRPFVVQAQADRRLWDSTGGTILSGHWPRMSQVVSSAMLVALTTDNIQPLGYVAAVGTGHCLFDDGRPMIGPSEDKYDTQVPTSVGDLIANEHNVAQDHGKIQITTIKEGDGSKRVIVTLPGTQDWIPNGGSNPIDFGGDLWSSSGGDTTYAKDVRLAMAQAQQDGDIPPGAPVLLVGHSYGAMVAGDLASDPTFVQQYNITNVVSVAGPTNNDPIDPNVNFLEVNGQFDAVSKTDLGGMYAPLPGFMIAPPPPDHTSGPNHTIVTLPSPGHIYDVATNHDDNKYAAGLNDSTDPGLLQYQAQLQQDGFLSTPGSSAKSIKIPVGRK